MRRMKYIFLALALCLLAGCSGRQPADPYAGMVQVESGYGAKMWIRPDDRLPVSRLAPEDFAGGRYIGSGYEAAYGIDVSEHQREIDWEAAAADGIDFVLIRAGYRGYSQGGLFEDAWFRANIEGARAAGLDVGIYFFSQAVNTQEAVEEAEFLLELLGDYPGVVTLPVFYDWETIGVEEARTDEVDGATLTDCAEAFCQTIEQAGYKAGIYFYRNLGYYSYELGRLSQYSFWAATLGQTPDFYYEHSFWQYSVTGSVDGIEGEVDMDMMFTPIVNEDMNNGQA